MLFCDLGFTFQALAYPPLKHLTNLDVSVKQFVALKKKKPEIRSD